MRGMERTLSSHPMLSHLSDQSSYLSLQLHDDRLEPCDYIFVTLSRGKSIVILVTVAFFHLLRISGRRKYSFKMSFAEIYRLSISSYVRPSQIPASISSRACDHSIEDQRSPCVLTFQYSTWAHPSREDAV